MIDVSLWRAVPERVADLLPRAIEIGHAYIKVAEQTGDLAGSTATWLVDEDVLVCYRPNAKRAVKFGHLDNGRCFRIRDINDKPDVEKEILIKKAALPGVSHVWDFANKALLGPTPLSNAIVSGLMLGGLGYGAGTLAENLFPERYLERGKFRRTLGLLGAGAGLGLGAMNAHANGRRTGKGFWSGLITRNDSDVSQYTPESRIAARGLNARERLGIAKQPAVKTSAAETVKESFQQFPSQLRQPGLFAPIVNVPQFNQAAWGDVQRGMHTNNFQNYTPPQFAAATTGLMTGISAAQRSPIIRPVDVIRGIASAGVGLATANLAGRTLSALAGLTPAGQEKLQDMGLWGGMMHAVVPAMFGNR
jgi:hypothetical protein